MAKSSKRQDVLETAERLFDQQGYMATGINQITREAEVAPMTLYNNFENKDALILAVLEASAKQSLAELSDSIDAAEDGPFKRILAIFDNFDAWVDGQIEQPGGFAGCNFVRAAVEFKDPDHPAHAASAKYKRAMIRMFENDLKEAQRPDFEQCALDLHLLLEGALVQAQILAIPGAVRRAKSIVKAMLEAK